MKLYNTLSRTIEDFVPNEEGKVKFYTCGPTVYHDQHIGNMRNYIGHDLLDKTLRYLGYDVFRVMNITDVGHLTSDSDSGEDKMVKSAKEKHQSVMDIAHFYTEQFFRDFKALNNRVPDVVAPATKHIEDYIQIIQKLLDTGYAYQAGGNVYFDTSKLKDYYQLTNHKEDDMVVGVRDGVEYDQSKRNQSDFVLWFTKSKFDDQELKWDTPFGMGYPGWHIECSGISMHYCGEYLDIHGGGVDNIFPHHTNEIAQSEAYVGHKWCNYWFHNEHLMDETGKMSKSKGATLTVSVLKEKGYDPLAYRYMCLSSHYRKQMVFSYESLDNASKAYEKLKGRVASLEEHGDFSDDAYQVYDEKFKACLEDDLNLPNALTLVYELLKSEESDATKIQLLKNWDQVFSLDLFQKKELSEERKKEIFDKIQERKLAKEQKDYIRADQIREELYSQGVILKDTRDGTIFELI